jgi:hypothetical protein
MFLLVLSVGISFDGIDLKDEYPVGKRVTSTEATTALLCLFTLLHLSRAISLVEYSSQEAYL